MTRRVAAALLGGFTLLLLGSTTASAAVNDPGFPDPGDAGMPGIPSGFIVIFVLVLIGGIATTVWKASMARTMARRSGMDPGEATAVTLLTDDGLDATYLAANLRGSQPAPAPAVPAPSPPRTTQDRLRELQELRDHGLVTAEEYEARRTAIVDSI